MTFEALTFPADDGLALVAYDAEPASRSADALRLLMALTSAPVGLDEGSGREG